VAWFCVFVVRWFVAWSCYLVGMGLQEETFNPFGSRHYFSLSTLSGNSSSLSIEANSDYYF